ncbi:MAG: HAMP domain-containing histidine kinase, partial [Actinomycetes bacterium]|nr:HAMP domain-containing histidine kinase [Actinomycetes bacterium]
RSDFFDKFLGVSLRNYIAGHDSEGVQTEVLDGEAVSDEGAASDGGANRSEALFSNVRIALPDSARRPELAGLSEDSRSWIIRCVGDETYLCVGSAFTIAQHPYLFSYIRTISSVYRARVSQYEALAGLNAALSVALAIGLYLLVRYISELEELTKSQEYFIHSLTHELKTPLTAIIGYSEFLRDTKYDEQTMIKGMDYMYSEAKRLEALSGKLMSLLLLKETEGRYQLCNLADLYRSVKDGLQLRLKVKNLILDEDIADCFVWAEPDLIRIVMTNLVDNALHASPDRGRIGITIACDRSDKSGQTRMARMARMVVVDEGIGMAREHLNRVFEPFYVADKSRARTSGGSGLGLTICKAIVDAHQGSIEIESEPGRGTRVTVTFRTGASKTSQIE